MGSCFSFILQTQRLLWVFGGETCCSKISTARAAWVLSEDVNKLTFPILFQNIFTILGWIQRLTSCSTTAGSHVSVLAV